MNLTRRGFLQLVGLGAGAAMAPKIAEAIPSVPGYPVGTPGHPAESLEEARAITDAHGFDRVSYVGNGEVDQTVAHNLGYKPDLIMIKKRPGKGLWETHHIKDTTR